MRIPVRVRVPGVSLRVSLMVSLGYTSINTNTMPSPFLSFSLDKQTETTLNRLDYNRLNVIIIVKIFYMILVYYV